MEREKQHVLEFFEICLDFRIFQICGLYDGCFFEGGYDSALILVFQWLLVKVLFYKKVAYKLAWYQARLII